MHARLASVIDVGNTGVMLVNVKKEPKKADVTKSKAPVVGRVKLATLIKQILKAAPDVAEKMGAGQNPFSISAKPAYIKPLTDILLSADSEDDRCLRLLTEVFKMSDKKASEALSLFKSALDAIINQQKESE